MPDTGTGLSCEPPVGPTPVWPSELFPQPYTTLTTLADAADGSTMPPTRAAAASAAPTATERTARCMNLICTNEIPHHSRARYDNVPASTVAWGGSRCRDPGRSRTPGHPIRPGSGSRIVDRARDVTDGVCLGGDVVLRDTARGFEV